MTSALIVNWCWKIITHDNFSMFRRYQCLKNWPNTPRFTLFYYQCRCITIGCFKSSYWMLFSFVTQCCRTLAAFFLSCWAWLKSERVFSRCRPVSYWRLQPNLSLRKWSSAAHFDAFDTCLYSWYDPESCFVHLIFCGQFKILEFTWLCERS